MDQFIFYSSEWLLPLAMLVILALSIELPYRVGKSRIVRDETKDDAWNAVLGGLVTLAAFVLGLSFAQASARFDARRELVLKEANAIGTTWLRADQLAPGEAVRFRKTLTGYTSDRLAAYRQPYGAALYRATIAQSGRDQAVLWSIASQALHAHPNQGLALLASSLNDTIDVSAEQLQALKSHVPTAMIVLMLALVTLEGFSLGIRFARDGARPAVLSVVFVLSCVIVITMSVDYDRPQTGLVTVDLAPLRLQLQSMQ